MIRRKTRRKQPVQVGDIYERWTILGEPFVIYDGKGKSRWLCVCECQCGNKDIIACDNLRRGETKSCGCLSREKASERALKRNHKHGLTHAPGYKIIDGIIRRCRNETDPAYPNYGGRGIDVWQPWVEDRAAFLAYIGERPSPSHTIDRIDNDWGYFPGNIQWATWRQQHNNRRDNVHFEWNGETHTIAEWSRRLGIPYYRLHKRLKAGVSLERALAESSQATHR